jgi:hypothetical protein
LTPRDFICTPSSWLTDSRLNALSDDAELLFRRLAACTDKNWRFPFDPTALEHSVRTAAFSPQRRFRAWSPDRIRRGLNELTAAGMLTRLFQGDRHWLEVAVSYRYVKGRDPFAIDDQPTQPELPEMAPGLFALPTPANPGGTKPPAPPSVERGGIPRRTESDQSRANESHARPTSTPEPSSSNRALSRGNDSENRSNGKFARDDGEFPGDSAWADFCRLMCHELVSNGALWAKRWRENRSACFEGLQDYLAKPPEERAAINPGAYITAAFERANKRSA